MDSTKVVFLTFLTDVLIDKVLSYAPDGYVIVVLGKSSTEENRISEARSADFLMCYGNNPSDDVLRSMERCRLVQTLAAGYDAMNLDLITELGIP